MINKRGILITIAKLGKIFNEKKGKIRRSMIHTTLDLIKEGKIVKILDIYGGWGIRQRLSCLGIHPGDLIIVKKSGIMHGPILVNIHGNQIALGRGIARKVLVEEVE